MSLVLQWFIVRLIVGGLLLPLLYWAFGEPATAGLLGLQVLIAAAGATVLEVWCKRKELFRAGR